MPIPVEISKEGYRSGCRHPWRPLSKTRLQGGKAAHKSFQLKWLEDMRRSSAAAAARSSWSLVASA